MDNEVNLVEGHSVFTTFGLLKLVALHKGLILAEKGPYGHSEILKTYVLDEKLLAILASEGIKHQARFDGHGDIFTLADENPQVVEVPGWLPRKCWHFKRPEGGGRKFDCRVFVNLRLEFDPGKGGITLFPQANGAYISPEDQLPHFRMFKTLVMSDQSSDDTLIVAKELIVSGGHLMVPWMDLGISGLRKLEDIFQETFGHNSTVLALARAGQDVFDPQPFAPYQQPVNELFVVREVQALIVEIWRRQLETYRARLSV
jgi:hypothetical protein